MIKSHHPYFVISDLQLPFEHSRALSFCKYVAKHYRIPAENILNVGDEVDCYHGGRWPKDPNGHFSTVGELAIARDKIKEWGVAFPKMKLCISNHGLRWVKKASAAEIPSQMLRSYQEIFHMPDGWKWKYEWTFKEKYPFRMIHGMGYSGQIGAKNAAMDAGISTLIGHLHSFASIIHVRTGNEDRGGMKMWAMNVGSLIDSTQYAFEYGKESRFQPCLGAGLVFDQGKTPLWIPLE